MRTKQEADAFNAQVEMAKAEHVAETVVLGTGERYIVLSPEQKRERERAALEANCALLWREMAPPSPSDARIREQRFASEVAERTKELHAGRQHVIVSGDVDHGKERK